MVTVKERIRATLLKGWTNEMLAAYSRVKPNGGLAAVFHAQRFSPVFWHMSPEDAVASEVEFLLALTPPGPAHGMRLPAGADDV